MDGKQGLFSVWLRLDGGSSTEAARLCLGVDNTIDLSDDTETCDPEYQRNVPSDNEWHKYEIPFTFGASSVEFAFRRTLLAGGDDQTLDIDQVYIGTVPDGHSIALQEMSEAHFVGKTFSSATNCIWTANGYTDWTAYPVDSDCTFEATGNIEAPDTLIPAFKIPNARTDGYYEVKAYAFYLSGASSYVCDYSLSSTSSYENQPTTELFTNEARGQSYLGGNFRFNSTGEKVIQILGTSNNASSICQIVADSTRGRNLTFVVHFFPDESQTVAKQATLSPDSAGFVFMSLLDIPESDTYLKADGRCVLRSKYPDYMKNGALDTYGTCTVTTTDDGVLLPDLRGYFPRFLDDLGTSQGAASVDVDGTTRVVGDTQTDAFKSHNHDPMRIGSGNGTGTVYSNALASAGSSVAWRNYGHLSNTGGTETRPVNMGFIPYVRMVDRNLIVGVLEQIEEVSIDLDASTANEFSAIIAIDGTVTSENIDFINGACTWSSGTLTCEYIGGIFSVEPSVQCSSGNNSGANASNCEIQGANSSTQLVLKGEAVGGSAFSSESQLIHVKVSKQGADVNKKLTGAIVNASKNPRAALQDQYSETEIKWGLWNGEQLYRRCFTVGSDITSSTTIVTWDASLNPKGIVNHSGVVWNLVTVTANASSSNYSQIYYEDSTGNVVGNGSTYKIGAGTSFCMNYTK